jgi:hypothetical protein
LSNEFGLQKGKYAEGQQVVHLLPFFFVLWSTKPKLKPGGEPRLWFIESDEKLAGCAPLDALLYLLAQIK